MNPQRGSKKPTVNPAAGEWGFVECKLLIVKKVLINSSIMFQYCNIFSCINQQTRTRAISNANEN